MEIKELQGFYIVLIQIGFVITFIVALFYGVITPWYKTLEGMYIFSLLAALSLTLGTTVIRIYFREWPYSLLLGIIFFSFYIVAVIVMGVGIYNTTIKRYLRLKALRNVKE